MKKMSIRLDKKEFFALILTLLSIWMSRTVFFGVVHHDIVRLIYVICLFVALFSVSLNKDRLKNVSIKTAIILILFSLNVLTCYENMNQTDYNAVFGYVIILLSGSIVAILISPELFTKYYIYIIIIYSIISIFCFIIANTNQDLAYSFCQEGYNWEDPYGYSLFYTWGINGTISSRNSGPFWEPGAFQGYIWIAIIFLLFNIDKNQIKNRKCFFVILIFTLLTTKSTTGYLLMPIAFIFFNKRICNILGIKKMNNKIILIIFIGLLGLALLSSSEVVRDKIGNDDNISLQMRTADVISGGALALKAGPFGLGETNNRDVMRASMGLYKDDSAGLIQLTYTFGWFMGLCYIVFLSNVPKQLFLASNRYEYFGLLLLLLILHMTEGIWSLPLFWILLLEKN